MSVNFYRKFRNKHYNINFWDFGGQEVMHAMHRCFLTSRTCYVVVIRSRRSETMTRARYWLRNIESFAAGSPVILAINEEHGNNINDLDGNRLRVEYPNIVDIINYNAIGKSRKDNRRFEDLIDCIQETVEELDSCRMEFPIAWSSIRDDLLELSATSRPYIDVSEYNEICHKHGLTDEEIQNWLLKWFNDLGVCFSYDKEEGVDQYKVLNPQWITNAIYTLINDGPERADNGILHRDSIQLILNQPKNSVLKGISYNVQEQDYILAVMRKFNLSYKINDNNEFIPALCSAETPSNLIPDDFMRHIRYCMKYIFLPDSVIHQLMISCYNGLNQKKLFRKGLCIEDTINHVVAVIDMGKDDQTLQIDLYSLESVGTFNVFSYLKNTIRDINRRLGLVAEECIKVQREGVECEYKLGAVLDAYQQGLETIGSQSSNRYISYSIKSIMENTFGEKVMKKLPLIIKEALYKEINLVDVFVKWEANSFEEEIDLEYLSGLFNKIKTNELVLDEMRVAFGNSLNPKVSEIGVAIKNKDQLSDKVSIIEKYLDDSTFDDGSSLYKTILQIIAPIITKYSVIYEESSIIIEEKMLTSLCDIGIQLQGNVQTYGHAGENERNTYVRDSFQNLYRNSITIEGQEYKLDISDQTLRGLAAGNVNPGELDLLVSLESNPFAIIEALNLDADANGKNWKKTYLAEHIRRLENYDQYGLPRNVVLVYVNTVSLDKFFENMKEYIEKSDSCTIFGERLNIVKDITSDFTENRNMRIAQADYNRNSLSCKLYFVVIGFIGN